MVALTNPKALLFMSAFLPQFINPAAPLFAQYATLAAVLALMNVATMLAMPRWARSWCAPSAAPACAG